MKVFFPLVDVLHQLPGVGFVLHGGSHSDRGQEQLRNDRRQWSRSVDELRAKFGGGEQVDVDSAVRPAGWAIDGDCDDDSDYARYSGGGLCSGGGKILGR